MEEEELECNASDVMSRPDEGAVMCPPPAPTAAADSQRHLDDASGDLVGEHPPGWGVLLDPDAPMGPVVDPEPAQPVVEAAPQPAFDGPTIGPQTGPVGPARSPYSGSTPTLREAARRDASEDAFDWRLGEQGPYMYGEHREGTGFHPGGTTFGFGVAHNPDEDGGGDLINAHFGAGEWRNQDGEEYEGIRFHGGFLSGSEQFSEREAGPDQMDVGVGTFDFGAYSTDETFTAGAQANLGEIAGTVGNEEHNLRGGLSEGLGLAFRAHYGDEDGDGVRERGVGADLGFVSFDLRSEHIGRAYDWAFGD